MIELDIQDGVMVLFEYAVKPGPMTELTSVVEMTHSSVSDMLVGKLLVVVIMLLVET